MTDTLSEIYRGLANDLRFHMRHGAVGACVFLGAGCSLSSSGGRQITTDTLVGEYVKEFGVETARHETFRAFVNLVETRGREQIAAFFREKLADMEPSTGYRALARLVKAGCFKYVLTTNFDLLLDRALELEGVAFDKVVNGDSTFPSSDRPLLVKVHGDIERGIICFTPRDLETLPNPVANLIEEGTAGLTVIVGYRGQDQGVMNSLNALDDFNAYWSCFDPIIYRDTYTYGRVKDWLTRRRSDTNLLNGPVYGDFDRLMTALAKDLGHRQPILPIMASAEISTVGALLGKWDETWVYDKISSVPRLATIFRALCSYVEDEAAKVPWCSRAPYYSPAADSVRTAFVHFFRAGELPDALIETIGNEADALIIAAAVEFKVQLVGRDLHAAELIERVREEYERFCEGYVLPEEFWDILLGILDDGAVRRAHAAVRIFLNNQHRLSLWVDNVPVQAMRNLMEAVAVVAMCFVGPTGAPQGSGDHAILSLLSRPQRPRGASGRRMTLALGSACQDVFAELCRRYLLGLAGAQWTAGSFAFISDLLEITAEPAAPDTPTAAPRTFAQAVSDFANCRLEEFLQSTRGFDTQSALVPLAADRWLEQFFAQQGRPGCLIVGSSGSGKTSALRNLLTSKGFMTRHVALVCMPRSIDADRSVLELFLPPELVSGRPTATVLADLADTFAARGKTLVLVVDGLNEMPCDLRRLARIYEELLRLGDAIEAGGLGIRLVITCRDATFETHLWPERKPNPRTFYSSRTNDTPLPYLRIGPLSRDEQGLLVDAYFAPEIRPRILELMGNPYFSAQLCHPYLLAVAGRVVRDPDDLRLAGLMPRILGAFAEDMLNRDDDSELRLMAERLLAGLARIGLSAGRQQWGAGRFELLESLPPDQRRLAARGLSHLVDLNLLVLHGGSGRVHFVHERLTEYFVGRLLHADLRRSALGDIPPDRFDPVLLGALRIYSDLSLCDGSGPDGAAITARLASDVRHLAAIPQAAAALTLSLAAQRPFPHAVLRSVAIEARRQGLADTLPASVILMGAAAAISRPCAANLAFLVEQFPAAGLALTAEDAVSLRLLSSKAAELMGDLAAAESEARRALKMAEGLADLALRDKADVQLAILCRTRGESAEAIDRFRAAVSSQKAHGSEIDAAVTELELGAALRDTTQFDEALTLYRHLWQRRDRLPSLIVARTASQMAIVMKNQLQTQLSDGDGMPDSLDETRVRAAEGEVLRYLDEASLIAEAEAETSMLLELASERAELYLVLYSYGRDNTRKAQAQAALDELERRMAYIFDPSVWVESRRYRARLCYLDGDVEAAWSLLEAAVEFSLARDLGYSAADCRYQLVRLAHDCMQTHPHLVKTGLALADQVVAFYEAETDGAPEYSKRVHRWRAALSQALG